MLYKIVSTKIELQTECSFCCSYRFVSFDEHFPNESAMLTSPTHGSKQKKVQFMAAKEMKNNDIIKQLSKMALYEKNGVLYTFRK